MSNSQISTFDFKSHPVRVELFKNEPHFCLTDVCTALEISNATASRFRFNEKGLHKMYTLTNGGKQEVTFINEPNLYRIIFRSNKKEAVEFQNWVFEEVLPQIRKTGKYEVQSQQLALPEPKPRGILLDEEAFYVVAKAIAKLNESTFEWEKMMDLFSELESHRNYKTAFNLGVASYNLAQSSEKIIMKNLAQMKNKVWKKEIEDFIFSNPHLQNHTENKLVHYLR
ncbi:Bro-N domain-containing protein [Pasteurella multocida]|uniref:BRO-N domain-containing protein n=1 Tax=Pasteurella multocida TaxID=747 RepID=UPI0031BB37C1